VNVMSAVPSDVYVRPARFEDFEGILDINRDVFSGNDYLSTCFYNMMHDPNQHPYVVVANGEIVSNILHTLSRDVDLLMLMY
jgi:hypothetical protein